MGNRYQTEKLVLIALMVALCVVLSFVDKTISSALLPINSIRLGLANIIVLTALYYLNLIDSLLLISLKTTLTGFILGGFTMFLIGAFGTFLSFIVMYTLIRLFNKKLSIMGISIAGAISHTIGQVLGLTLTEFYNETIVFTLIWLIPLSVGTGFCVGLIVTSLRKYLDKGQVFKSVFNSEVNHTQILSIIEEEN